MAGAAEAGGGVGIAAVVEAAPADGVEELAADPALTR